MSTTIINVLHATDCIEVRAHCLDDEPVLIHRDDIPSWRSELHSIIEAMADALEARGLYDIKVTTNHVDYALHA